MNNLSTNKMTIKTKIYQLFSLSLLVTLLFSCSSKEDNGLSSDGTTLLFAVAGVEEPVSIEALASTGTGQSRMALANTADGYQNETLVSTGGVDALLSTDERISYESVSNGDKPELQASTNPALKPNLLAASVPMTGGVKYRILIYDATNTLIRNVEATSGTNPQIKVDGHRAYTWYAVSFNTSTAPVVTNGVVSGASAANQDLIYASGSIASTADGDNYINISFKRKTARIQVELNTRGLFGTIQNTTSVSVLNDGTSLIRTGDFNVLTNSFSNYQDVATANILASSMSDVTGNPASTVKLANFYTLNTTAIAANKLKVRLNKLDIKIDDNRTRSFANNLIYTFQNGYTPAIGASYNLKVRLVESPLQVNGILWARTNLVYNASATDKYRLKANSDGSTSNEKDTEFWNWMATTPTGTVGSGDPCALVYPAGTWKMPTKAQYETLGQADSKAQAVGILFGYNYTGIWNKDAAYPTTVGYDSDNLVVPYGGYRTAPGIFGTSVSSSPAGILLGLLAYGELHYWSSDAGTSAGQGYAAVSTVTKLAIILDWTNITYPSKAGNEGRNVRCVRAKTNPTAG